MGNHHGTLVQMRAFLSQQDLKPGDRLPPERELCRQVGATRGELRKALAVLEAEGMLWRHVGKGTFVGGSHAIDSINLGEVARRASPAEVMRARLAIEPALAGEAALHGSSLDVEAMRACTAQSRAAGSWREYEACDNHFHKLVAEASGNCVIATLYDCLAGIRRTVVWARRRDDSVRPPRDHHSFGEHDAIIDAIAQRDRGAATAAMLRHLESVERYLFGAERARAHGAHETTS